MTTTGHDHVRLTVPVTSGHRHSALNMIHVLAKPSLVDSHGWFATLPREGLVEVKEETSLHGVSYAQAATESQNSTVLSMRSSASTIDSLSMVSNMC